MLPQSSGFTFRPQQFVFDEQVIDRFSQQDLLGDARIGCEYLQQYGLFWLQEEQLLMLLGGWCHIRVYILIFPVGQELSRGPQDLDSSLTPTALVAPQPAPQRTNRRL